MPLNGKSAVITGGARGIGYAIARRYLSEGVKVVIADIDDDAGENAAQELSELGDIRFKHADVGSRLDVHNLVASTIDLFGDIDILVANAGTIIAEDFLYVTEEQFDQVMRVNLKGAFLCGQAVAKHMVAKVEDGGAPGTIINMSSVNAVFAIANQVPYTISKGGVKQLTNVMAQALAPHGIRVNAIGPGSIMTDMFQTVATDDSARHRVLSRTPMGRIGDPEEIAGIAAFLASDDAAYITGQTIYADGGRLGLNYTVPVQEN
ncbi:MAG: SDR family oxidoreductase [Pseudomonadota bacterium]